MLPLVLFLLGQGDIPAPQPKEEDNNAAGIIILLLSNAATIGVSVYLAISRRRAERATEKLATAKEERGMTQQEKVDAVNEAWAQAKQQATLHKQAQLEVQEQLKAYRQELVDLRKNEREMYARAMTQAETIRYLKEENDELKDEMARRGWREGSNEHRPIQPGAEVDDGQD